MSKMNMVYKAIVLVLFPLIMGFLIEKLLVDNITGLGSLLLGIWLYGGGIVFWLYVGGVFGKFKMSAVKKYILGNIIWGIFLVLYIWQSALTQYYSLGFVGVSTQILGLFTNSLSSTTIILFSHFLMLLVFSLGFLFAMRFKSLKTDQT